MTQRQQRSPQELQANAEKMVKELITYLKRRKLWETDCGIIFNGVSYSHWGNKPTTEITRGVARMWFEGVLYRMIYHGIGDPEYKTYKRLTEIMNKHGFYPEFGSAVEFNIYPI